MATIGLDSTQASRVLIWGAVVFAAWAVQKLFFTKRQLPLPPGPKGLPLVGNIRDLPPPGVPEWEHWLQHKDLYGPLSSVTALGTTMILIHDKDVALELLEKRSAKYSGRPFQRFVQETCGFAALPAFQQNGHKFRQQRRLMAAQMGSRSSMAKFQSAIEFQVRHFLLNTMNSPEDLEAHLQRESGSLMLETLYGYTANAKGRDPLVVLINKFMAAFNDAAVPGAWLIDVIPWLKYVPDWMPGAGFKKTARVYKKLWDDVTGVPFEFSEEQMSKGDAKPSFISGLLQQNPTPEEREAIRDSATGLYSGGADTTVAALGFFFLAMTVFPDVQKKAREEIDRVTGGTRLPGVQDREQLPYVEATLKEALRWYTIAPMGLPHATDEEDTFRGYRIPKGSLIIPAIAWFTRDPEVYPEPEQFKPERFLGPDPAPNPMAVVFGFGRRICPGRHLAEANMFLVIAQSLAAFNIGKAVDKESGKLPEPKIGILPGVVGHPIPFRSHITPRSEKHAEWVRNIEVEQPWGEGDAELLQTMRRGA